ncbi:MAG: hypothetical protein R3F62_13560 [Planctomycetota bacterium]
MKSREHPLDCIAWMRSVAQNPLGHGKEGALLSLLTACTLILSFVFFGKSFYGLLPAGRYPAALLMLPFLAVTFLVYCLLSPVFYALYLRRLPPPLEVEDPA